MKDYSRKSAVSFCFEHGIFLREKDREKMKVSKGEALCVSCPKEDVYGYEICRDFKEIDHEKEAKILLALFEGLTENHFMFFVRHGIIKQSQHKAKQIDPLVELYPDLDARPDSAFAHFYRKVVDKLIDLVYSGFVGPNSSNMKPRVKKEINGLTQALSISLKSFYEEAECVVGVGDFLSNQLGSKPIELSFGIGELDIGIISRILGNKRVVVNPFLLEWVMSEFCEVKKGEIRWTQRELVISKPTEIPQIPIKTLTIKSYIPSKSIIEAGVTENLLEQNLRRDLESQKPFLLESDFVLPFSCPSIVLSIEGPERVGKQVPAETYYGDIPEKAEAIYRLSPVTTFKIVLFGFPLFNRKSPVVLDTSAIDISRFPLSPVGSFFKAYLEKRVLVIPTAVLHELKTRLRSADRIKVEKALVRLNNMLSWGLIEDLKIEGEFPELSLAKKEDIEDLRDCMILDTARKLGGIVFTNDRDLIKLAAMIGTYTITFSGIEEDVLTVIRENNLKLNIASAIKKVQGYGTQERGEEYQVADIKWMIDDLCKQGRLCTQRLGAKEVLQYVGPRLRRPTS